MIFSCPLLKVHCSGMGTLQTQDIPCTVFLHRTLRADGSWDFFCFWLALSTHSCHIYPPAVIPPSLAMSGMLRNLKGIHHVLIVLLNLAYPWPSYAYKGIQTNKEVSSWQHLERRNLSWGITTSHCLWTYLWAIFLTTEQCRKAQSTVSSAIHGRVVLGYTRKLAEQHVSK